MFASARAPRSRRGLTLIELVVVLTILAALSMLIIPRMDFLKSQADDAQSASGSADVAANLQEYKVAIGNYPLRMDSLLATTTNKLYSKVWFDQGTTELTPGTLTGAQAFSLAFALGFADSNGNLVMDHDETAADPNNSGTKGRAFKIDGSDQVAVVNPTAPQNLIGTSLLAAAGYPNGLPTTGPAVQLVALGVGPQNSAVGRTMTNAPRLSLANADTEYGRFIAIFAVYDDPTFSTKADLRLVVDSHRYTTEDRARLYQKGTPTVN